MDTLGVAVEEVLLLTFDLLFDDVVDEHPDTSNDAIAKLEAVVLNLLIVLFMFSPPHF